MSNFQELRGSSSQQALPSYTLLNSAIPNQPQEPSYCFRQNQSTLPLTFNSPYKPKLKKAPRPKSRGPQDQGGRRDQQSFIRNQNQQGMALRSDSKRGRLQDFSKTSSSAWSPLIMNVPIGIQAQRNSPYNIDRPTCRAIFQKQGSSKLEGCLPKAPEYFLQDEKRWPETHVSSFKVMETREGRESQTGAHTSYLLQEIQFQRKTIDSFQQEILSLNQQLLEARGRNGKERHDPKKDLLGRNQSLEAELESLRKDFEGKIEYNSYLQGQCKHYQEKYEQSEKARLQIEEQYQKIQDDIKILGHQLQLREALLKTKDQEIKEKQNESRILKNHKYQEIDRLTRLTEAQASKLQEAEQNNQLDRSQISLLMMKLESLVEKNEQLMKSSVEASRWRTLCEEAEREHKKFSDRCLVLEKEVAALSNRLAATKQASEKQEEQFESQGKLWRSQVDKLQQQLSELKLEVTHLNQCLQAKIEVICLLEQSLLQAEIAKKNQVGLLTERLSVAMNQLTLSEVDCQQLRAFKIQIEGQLIAKETEQSQLLKQLDKLKEDYCQLKAHNIEESKRLEEKITNNWNIDKLTTREDHERTVSQLRQKIEHIEREYEQQIACLQQELSAKHQLSLQQQVVQQKLQADISALNCQLEHLKDQLANASSRLHHESLQQRRAFSEAEEHQFIEVDRQGLEYLCGLLGVTDKNQGILNTIISSLIEILTDRQRTSTCLESLLQTFEIAQGPLAYQELFASIDQIPKNISLLLERINELESTNLQSQEQLQILRLEGCRRTSKPQKAADGWLGAYASRLEELNQDLNSQVASLCSRLLNSKLVSRKALSIAQGITADHQEQHMAC